jgi:putative ABC transport system permease protein
MRQDIFFGLRYLRRNPVITIVATITLAIGIGGATTVFSVVDAVLLRPLPFVDADRVVRVDEVTPDGAAFSFSDPNYLDLQAQSRAFAHLAAYRVPGRVTLGDGGEPFRQTVVPTAATIVDVLGTRPALGRFFSSAEDRHDAGERPLVLSDALWRRRFNADPDVLGRTVSIDGRPSIVVGVMPADFAFPKGVDAWIPLGANPSSERGDKSLTVVGSLAKGVTIEQARGDVAAFGRRISATHPVSNAGWTVGIMPIAEWLVAPQFRTGVLVLFYAVGLLLLLACANVANLLVARGASRHGEMRVRAALGASRRRLARQLLTESSVVGLLGTGAGILVAFWSVAAIRALGEARIPRIEEVEVNAAVLGFACLAGIVSCVVSGLAPALQAAQVDLRSGMDDGARHTTRSRRLQNSLVVGEVALALVLVVGAGLLANSFVRLVRVDSGFDANGLVAVPLEIPVERYPDAGVIRFYADLIERVRAIPGVSAASATSTDPFRQFGFGNNVTPEDRAAAAPSSGLLQAGWRSITPGFFAAARVPLIRGRDFSAADRRGGERVVIVSQSLARQLWPNQDAVGRRLFWGGTTGRPRTVVGVSGDLQDVNLGAAPQPMLFVPHAQVDVPGMTLLVRTPLDAAAVAPSLRAAVREMDPAMAPPEVHAVSASRAEAAGGSRFNLWVLGAFAGIALVLAVTGVYAMLSFAVVQRRRELAIRLALGADSSSVVRLLLGGGLTLAAAGVGMGLLAATAAARVMTKLLYGIAPTDLLTFTGAALLLLGAAALACYLPARRAGRLDPLAALRE